jgi:hypothetical protein
MSVRIACDVQAVADPMVASMGYQRVTTTRVPTRTRL